MWTDETRARYDRSGLRYPSDLTDDEWALVKPLIPPAKPGGRKRKVDEREVVNGIMYVLSTGCQWRYIPKDLPPRSTLHDYFDRWNYDGTLERIPDFCRGCRHGAVLPRSIACSANPGLCQLPRNDRCRSVVSCVPSIRHTGKNSAGVCGSIVPRAGAKPVVDRTPS